MSANHYGADDDFYNRWYRHLTDNPRQALDPAGRAALFAAPV
jgi:hypothetical protein